MTNQPTHPELQAPVSVWRQRMVDARGFREQAIVLTDMVLAHMAVGSYEREPFGRCCALLKAIKDPLRAQSLLFKSMGDVEREGDPVRWAIGMAKRRATPDHRPGSSWTNGQTITAAEYIKRFGLPEVRQ